MPRFPVLGRTGNPFAGFELQTGAGAIHAVLRFGNAPMTLDSIILETSDIADEIGVVDYEGDVKGHLKYWGDRNVYIETAHGRALNPDAIYEREWKRATEEEAKEWYDSWPGVRR